ncbi:MAG TPA: NB-ARC domain-containing protein, partial [Fimbriimonadaceae bacterium]|nr:NB-ARC domain-containing protein [Fimbriimonadaceae bacterium]
MAVDLEGFGKLSVAASVRSIASGDIDTVIQPTVLDAVEYAIAALSNRKDRIGVVVAGEGSTAAQTDSTVASRAEAIARTMTQAGLFLTLAAQDIVRDRLREEVHFEDFGVIEAEGADRAERIFAVFHPDLPEPAVPHRRVTGNWRAPSKSFVGRGREVDELQDLVFNRSIVTITGFPGVGKSMTALHVAGSVSEEHDDGIWWFSVEDRATFSELLGTIGTTKGLLGLKGEVTVERIAEGLAKRKCVIVLDGCERMRDDVRTLVSAVVARSQGLTFLLTSTKPIGVEGENVYRLDPMSLPDPSDAVEEVLLKSDAVNLFCQRATQAGGKIPIDEVHVDLAIQICEKIDALPIAIELIAATTRTSSLSKIAADLERDASTGQDALGLSSRLRALER